MAKITSNSGSLIINDSQSISIGLLRCQISNDKVIVTDGVKTSWTLDYKNTTVDGSSFNSAIELLAAISAFSRGGGDGTGVTWDDTSILPESGKIAVFSEQGLLSTGTPEFPENTVPLSYLDLRIPISPADGNFILKSIDGVVSWVAE